MKIVTRYMATEFAKTAALCLFVTVGLFFLIDSVDRSGGFLSKGAPASDVLAFQLLKLPAIFVQIAPVATLLAVLATISIRVRSHELTAMFAGGVSLLRVCIPVLAGCAVVSILSFTISEVGVPAASRASKEIARRSLRPGSVAATFSMNRYWIRGESGIVSAAVVDPATKTLSGFSYIELSPSFAPKRIVSAREARWAGEGWTLIDGTDRGLDDPSMASKSFKAMPLSIGTTVQGFLDGETPPSEMDADQLADYVNDARSHGYDMRRYATDLHAKFSYPLLNTVVCLLAIPFALSGPRSGGIFRAVGLGLLIGFACWMVLSVSLSMGRKGLVPPVVAAWAPALIFATVGGLLLRFRGNR